MRNRFKKLESIMDKETIKSELISIITPYIPEKSLLDNLTDDKDLINDLSINSAHIVDIVLDIEEKYDIMMEDDLIGNMNTVKDAVDIISKKLESK